MHDGFDPYTEWLGFPPGRPPGSYYELLGIAPDEGDESVIAQAADGLCARIRRIRPGRHVGHWQRLLDAVCEAKQCLLDPEARSAYDADLRAEPTEPASAPLAGVALRRCRRVAPRPKPSRFLIPVLLVVVFALGSTLWTVLCRQAERAGPGSEPPEPDAALAIAHAPSDGETAVSAPIAGRGTKDSATRDRHPRPSVAPRPRNDSPWPTLPAMAPARDGAPAPDDRSGAAQITAFDRAVADARRAMSAHDVEGARRHLGVAGAGAVTADQKAEVARLTELAGYLDEFWKAVHRVAGALRALEEVPVGDTYVIVVENRSGQLTLKAAGQTRSYSLDRLPPKLVWALAESRLADDPATKALKGAYLLVDPEGDRARAQGLWHEASAAGVDLADLMPELDLWGKPASSSAMARWAVPADPKDLEAAEQTVRERLGAALDDATTPETRAGLAKRLIENGDAVADDFNLRFAMLRQARDLAVEAGDAALACEAVDRLAAFHDVDAIAMKATVLEQTAQKARGLSGYRALTQQALSILPEALDARRTNEADRLAAVAVATARKSNSRSLVEQALAAQKKLETILRQE